VDSGISSTGLENEVSIAVSIIPFSHSKLTYAIAFCSARKLLSRMGAPFFFFLEDSVQLPPEARVTIDLSIPDLAMSSPAQGIHHRSDH